MHPLERLSASHGVRSLGYGQGLASHGGHSRLTYRAHSLTAAQAKPLHHVAAGTQHAAHTHAWSTRRLTTPLMRDTATATPGHMRTHGWKSQRRRQSSRVGSYRSNRRPAPRRCWPQHNTASRMRPSTAHMQARKPVPLTHAAEHRARAAASRLRAPRERRSVLREDATPS